MIGMYNYAIIMSSKKKNSIHGVNNNTLGLHKMVKLDFFNKRSFFSTRVNTTKTPDILN